MWLELIREWLGASGVEWVCPFSYHARGTATRRSDLDLLVLWPTELPPLECLGRVLWALRDLPLPVEAIVLTPQEFANRRELPFLRGVMKEAKLIYERGETAA